MSASLIVNKNINVKFIPFLMLSALALGLSTPIYANDGLKPIKSNTTSVTKGNTGGAASSTSSTGSSATYNSGIDWARASGLPWKGINWSAGGTIPQSRIPKLSTSQMPSSMPSNWNTGSLSGTACGLGYENKGKSTSTGYVNLCSGKNPASSCPSGYTKKQTFKTTYEYSTGRPGQNHGVTYKTGTMTYYMCFKN